MSTMLILFGAVLLLVLINVPIAVSLGIVAVVAMLSSQGLDSLPNMALVIYNGATNFPLLAIPLFILAGAIMNASGISQRLIAFASAIFGWVRGGLAHVSIGASLFFAEISGSAVADVAALGSILIPGMKKKGYPGPYAAAAMSSAATLAVIIPPSIPMILYAVMAETSVVQMFVAGIVPGLIGAFGLMAMASFLARRYNLPRDERFSAKRILTTGREALWAFALPIIILGGIFGGIVTATEGAALAVVAALFVGLVIYRELDLKHLRAAIMEGGSDRGGDAAGGHQCLAGHLPDRGAGTAGPGQGGGRFHFQQMGGAGLAQCAVPVFGHVPAFGCCDHPGDPDCHALGTRSGYRPGALWPDCHHQPGHWSADPASGQRADGGQLDCQGLGMGGLTGQHLVHRGPVRRVDAGDLCASDWAGTGQLLLPLKEHHE